MRATLASDRLDATFAALANPTRRAILGRLALGSATINELAEPFDLTLPAISKHIKVLQQAGLVVKSQDAQYRPCALNANAVREVANWADQYRPIWDARLDRMETQLANPQQKGPRP
ncbi:MAG: metalloregulator ArsR/SmtB family transcription factor [bacterium]|nr:metalloregulator ArsR/SmtB family transcription factor [bacterium]